MWRIDYGESAYGKKAHGEMTLYLFYIIILKSLLGLPVAKMKELQKLK